MKITIHTSKEGAEAAIKLLTESLGMMSASDELRAKKGIKGIDLMMGWRFLYRLKVGLRRSIIENDKK